MAEPGAGAAPAVIGAALPPEAVAFAGPAGRLEGLIDLPEGAPCSIAVVCHPHPLFAGTMQNKVAYTLAPTPRKLKRSAAAPWSRSTRASV